MQIFFALLSGVVLNNDPADGQVEVMGIILMVLQAVPPFFTAFLASPLSVRVLDPAERAKMLRMFGKVKRKLAPRLELAWARWRRTRRSASAAAPT